MNSQGLEIEKGEPQWEGIENGFPIIKIKEGSPHNSPRINEDIVEPRLVRASKSLMAQYSLRPEFHYSDDISVFDQNCVKLVLPGGHRDVSKKVKPDCQRPAFEDGSQDPGESGVIYRPGPLILKVAFGNGDQNDAGIRRQPFAPHPREAVIGFQFQRLQAAGLPKKQEETRDHQAHQEQSRV
jgi:hypothetical protein